MKIQIRLLVSGFEHNLLIEPHWTLVDVLGDILGLTGTKNSSNLWPGGAGI